jgi:hypothetical protein
VIIFSPTATTLCAIEMKDEPLDAVTVKEITTDGKVTSLYYPNPEDVMIVKQPKEASVFIPKSKENVCTFYIAN